MKIGQAARGSGLEPSAIRFYESAGVVPGPPRSPAGYRHYSAEGVELLRFVRLLRALELPLDDIGEIVALRSRGEAPCRPVREALARASAAIDTRIEELGRLRADLDRLLAAADNVTDDWPGECVCHVIESRD